MLDGNIDMDEEYLKKIIDIEKNARAMREKALQEAQALPQKAEQDAKSILSSAQEEAKKEAERILASVKADQESKKILQDAEAQAGQKEAQAAKSFEKGVDFVLKKIT